MKPTINRRTILELNTEAEKLLYSASVKIETLGASTELTEIITQLTALRNKLADYIDSTLPLYRCEETMQVLFDNNDTFVKGNVYQDVSELDISKYFPSGSKPVLINEHGMAHGTGGGWEDKFTKLNTD